MKSLFLGLMVMSLSASAFAETKTFNLNNMYIDGSAIGKEWHGIVVLDALGGDFFLPVLGNIVGRLDKSPCLRARTLVQSLSTNEMVLDTGECRDKTKPLDRPVELLGMKMRWGFTVNATIADAKAKEVHLRTMVLSRDIVKGIRVCSEVLEMVQSLNVKEEKNSDRPEFVRTQKIKFRGSCEITDNDEVRLSLKGILE